MSRGGEGPIGTHFADLMEQEGAVAVFTGQNVVKASVSSIWRLDARDRALPFVVALFGYARACRFEAFSSCRNLFCYMLQFRG